MDINSLNTILDQLSAMYAYIIENQKNKVKITPEIQEVLRIFSSKIDEISKITDQEIARAGLKREGLDATIYGLNKEISPEIKKILKKALFLKKEIVGCQNVVKKHSKQRKEEAAKKGGPNKRKDKFKNIGSKKGWIPL